MIDNPKKKKISARFLRPSSKKNSPSIQTELAQIQNTIAQLCKSSDLSFRCKKVMQAARTKVGTIITIPRFFEKVHQQRSFNSQNTMCKFSSGRYRLRFDCVFMHVHFENKNNKCCVKTTISIRNFVCLFLAKQRKKPFA